MKVKRYYIVAVLSAMLILPLTACSGVKEVTDFPVSVAIGDSTLNGQFTGAVEKKQPNGQGVFNYSDGSTQQIGRMVSLLEREILSMMVLK